MADVDIHGARIDMLDTGDVLMISSRLKAQPVAGQKRAPESRRRQAHRATVDSATLAGAIDDQPGKDERPVARRLQ